MPLGRIQDLTEKMGETGGGKEIRYKCPYCINEIGKEDTKGKFYYNPEKRKGICHRCGTVVKDDSIPAIGENFERLLKLTGFEALRDEEEAKGIEFNLRGWTTPLQANAEVYKYAKKRGLDKRLAKRYHLRACSSPIKGIVFPNIMLDEGTTDYLQIRDIDEDTWIKYRNVSGNKPLYGVGSIGNRTKGVMAEGVISAISASRLDKRVAGLATYGKSITDIQEPVIKSLPIKEFYVMYDGGFLGASVKACNTLLRLGKQPHLCMLPFGEDPNDTADSSLEEAFGIYCIRYTHRYIGSMIFQAYNRDFHKKSGGVASAWNGAMDYIRKAV